MSELQDIFREEAGELLIELEEGLLELESDLYNIDIVDRIFRAMHTIKGSGGMCDFPNVTLFTHELETTFDKVRKGEVTVNRELIEIGLAAHHYLSDLIANGDLVDPKLKAVNEQILTRLHIFSPDLESGSHNALDKEFMAPISIDLGLPKEMTLMRIRFKPCEEFLTYGLNPLHQLKELSELGECKLVAYTSKVPLLSEIVADTCYISWEILLSTDKSKEQVLALFSFIEEDCELVLEIIDQQDEISGDYKRLGDILVERGDLKREQVNGLFVEQPLIGEKIQQSGLVSEEKIKSALLEQEVVRAQRQERKKTASQDSIRVSAVKLDQQMNLVGELVIALARLNQLALKSKDTELSAIADELDQLITEVRDNVLGIRMLPIGSTFSKFRRLVRDLSTEQGKEIELVTHGADTELDKTVIEQLSDPLTHLIRNSLDHGIEHPDTREANGKNRKGEITLTAKQAQGQVLIEIKDDGKGIDPNVIRHKALEKGLISADAQLTEKEIFAQIFAAGFSTAETVTNISGRGVGMDVVKRSIDSLRGSIDIDSVLGKGTTITLRLPLTLAIIEGLLVKVGQESLVIPLTMVEECVETQKNAFKSSQQGFVLRVRKSLIPCISLGQWLGNNSELPDLVQVIIVKIDGEQYGLIVDDVIGQQQTVIKSLGSIYQSIKGVSGATILGDGSVAVIIDLQQVVQLYALSSDVA